MALIRHTVTPAQLAAHRRNAQKSTGPRTPAGKLRSSLNSLKYAPLSVKLPARMRFEGEDVCEDRKMHRQLMALFLPQNLDQSACLMELAEAWWEKVRALRGLPARPFRPERRRQAEARIEEGLEDLILALRASSRQWRSLVEALLGGPFESLAELRGLVEEQWEVVGEAAGKFRGEVDGAAPMRPFI